tara:strand:+ start:541 stop:1266 length:726 start_codon:yes stop_codon:yes gene_type:complete
MNIGILGYGKMGKSIEQIALDRGHNIIFKSNNINNRQLSDNLDNIDVMIEFSNPLCAFNNIVFCLDHHIPIVSGTTGWLDKLIETQELCAINNGSFVYSTNFSVGMNIMFMINDLTSKIINHTQYHIDIQETHHIAKKDTPSGTAITIANTICANTNKLKSWESINMKIQTRKADKIPILSKRVEGNTGEHHVKYISNHDELKISHKSLNRKGFAEGAIIAAEFIQFKTGYYTMSDIIKTL